MPIGAYWTFRRMRRSHDDFRRRQRHLDSEPNHLKNKTQPSVEEILSEKILNLCKSYVYHKTNGKGYVDVSPSLKSERKIFECYKNRESQWAFACLTMQGERILGFMNEDFKKYVKEKL